MISYQSALESLRSEGSKRWPQWATEKVSVYDCAGRYSARELFALDNNPRFNCSAMDGFALSSTDTTAASEQAPQQLSVVGCLQAGDLAAETECQSRSCVEIMTGARMPETGGGLLPSALFGQFNLERTSDMWERTSKLARGLCLQELASVLSTSWD